MTTPRRGRPPVIDPRSLTVRYRVTATEMATLQAAASAAGLSVTDYARAKALAAAKRGR